MIRKVIPSVLMILGLFLQSGAQNIDMEQTIDYINRKLGGAVTIEVKRGYIISKYFDNGELYREDHVSSKDLNINSIKYDAENRLLLIDCRNNLDCVDRQLYIRKISRSYGRISFPVSVNAKSADGLTKAFKHLLKLVENPKYESDEPFE